MSGRRPNVLLMVADTQRAANLRCYGYEKETSPTWDAVAAEGCVCEQNISAGIWSLPGYASMMTGVHVYTHRGDADHEYVNAELPTLAGVLGEAGYQTCGIMDNTWGSGPVGLDRGFEVYVDGGMASRNERPPTRGWELPEFEAVGGTARNIETVGKWLDTGRDADRPFFLFTIFGQPHATYHPPEEYIAEYMMPGVSDAELESVMERQDVIAAQAEAVTFSQREWRILHCLNDAEVRACDDSFQAVLDELRSRGLYDDTVIILTSDHGDVMGDRFPWWGHLGEICDSLIHVPLIIRHPDHFDAGTRIEGITQTHDIFATLCEIAGVPAPGSAADQSHSLIAAARGEGLREFALAEHYKPVQLMERIWRRFPDFDVRRLNRSLKAWRSTTEKYVYSTDGRDELYDLRTDPNQLHNLAAMMPDRTRELRDEMIDFLLTLPHYEFGDMQSAWRGKAAVPEIADRLSAMNLYRKSLDWPEWAPR